MFTMLNFLLEYRDEAISLQYSPKEDFTLPPNLFVISRDEHRRPLDRPRRHREPLRSASGVNQLGILRVTGVSIGDLLCLMELNCGK
jgi:5-methylcytosine-specific restriction protein B